MQKLKLFEDFSRSLYDFPKGPYSKWPKQQHSRGVKVTRQLFPNDDADLVEIEDHVLQGWKKQEWFKNWVSGDRVNLPKHPGMVFLEVMRPDGIVEILSFEDFDTEDSDYATSGSLSSTTMDGKYGFTINANSYSPNEYEIDDFSSLDWTLNKS